MFFLNGALRVSYSMEHHGIIGSASESIEVSDGCIKIDVPSIFSEL
jgi:hypothetical protein